MRILNAYVCDYAFLSNGKMSLISIFEQFNFPKLPNGVPMFYVALQVEAESKESLTIGARITRPNGQTLREVGIKALQAPGGTGAVGIWLQFGFGGIQFTEPGRHAVEIIVGSDVVHSIPLQVNWRQSR